MDMNPHPLMKNHGSVYVVVLTICLLGNFHAFVAGYFFGRLLTFWPIVINKNIDRVSSTIAIKDTSSKTAGWILTKLYCPLLHVMSIAYPCHTCLNIFRDETFKNRL